MCFTENTTLDIYCRPDRCKLFYTKEGATPVEFNGLLQAAQILGERSKRGLELFELTFPFWAIESYKANERALEKAEAEYTAKQNEDEEDDSLSISKGGDSDAFAAIEEQFKDWRSVEFPE